MGKNKKGKAKESGNTTVVEESPFNPFVSDHEESKDDRMAAPEQHATQEPQLDSS